MRGLIVCALLGLASFALQSAQLPPPLGGALRIDLLLALLMPCALLYSPLGGALVGCFFGLCMDSLFGRGMGYYALPYLLALFGGGWAGERLPQENPIVPGALCLAACLLREVFYMLVHYFARLPLAFTGAALGRAALGAAITALISVAAYLPLFRFYQGYARKRAGALYGRISL